MLRMHACCAILLAGSAAAMACSSSDEPGPEPPAEPATWQLGPITVVEEPDSHWTVTEAEDDAAVVAWHSGLDVSLLIDASNADDDGRYAGIYVFEGGDPRFTGSYYGSHCSMFVPDRPHVDQTAVTVTAAGVSLAVEMMEGSLSEMSDAQFPSDEPFRWTSSWSADGPGLRLQSGGLYYLLVPKERCDVTVLGEGGAELGSTHIDSDTSPFLTYFDDVRTIAIASQPLGQLSVSTDAAVLQVEVTSYPDTSLFELDFDHSFKDRGQLDVRSELALPLTQP